MEVRGDGIHTRIHSGAHSLFRLFARSLTFFLFAWGFDGLTYDPWVELFSGLVMCVCRDVVNLFVNFCRGYAERFRVERPGRPGVVRGERDVSPVPSGTGCVLAAGVDNKIHTQLTVERVGRDRPVDPLPLLSAWLLFIVLLGKACAMRASNRSGPQKYRS